jgi:hypothetical protein
MAQPSNVGENVSDSLRRIHSATDPSLLFALSTVAIVATTEMLLRVLRMVVVVVQRMTVSSPSKRVARTWMNALHKWRHGLLRR